MRRTSRVADAIPAQGRPVGLLAAWLSDVVTESCFDHPSHISPFLLALCSLEKRQAARAFVATLPGGMELLAFERKPRTGEDTEPEEID